MRSNVFNGTQPSNEGCTNGASIDGQVTIDCGQGTTVIEDIMIMLIIQLFYMEQE